MHCASSQQLSPQETRRSKPGEKDEMLRNELTLLGVLAISLVLVGLDKGESSGWSSSSSSNSPRTYVKGHKSIATLKINACYFTKLVEEVVKVPLVHVEGEIPNVELTRISHGGAVEAIPSQRPLFKGINQL
jgi:hypothetical protein